MSKSTPSKPPAKPVVYVLDREVLVVAKVTFPPNLWKAFLGVVPGRNHDEEWESVLAYGSTVTEKLARFLFPEFADCPYDR